MLAVELVLQLLVQALGLLDRRHVHDAVAPGRVDQRAQRLVLGHVVDGAADLEAQVRAREAGDRHRGVAHPELAHDVGAHLRGRRRGERQHRRAPEAVDHRAEREVVGAEVVPPLADAVRLVDDEEAHLALQQHLEEVAVLEPLGRDVEDVALALRDRPLGVARLARRLVRVERERVDALRDHLVLLVLHERDERAHDQRQPLEHQRGELVDERLPAAGRHHDERVAPAEDRLDRLVLPVLEVVEAEAVREDLARARARQLSAGGLGRGVRGGHALIHGQDSDRTRPRAPTGPGVAQGGGDRLRDGGGRTRPEL